MAFKESKNLSSERMGSVSEEEKKELINEINGVLREINQIFKDSQDLAGDVTEEWEDLIKWAEQERKKEQPNADITRKNIEAKVSELFSQIPGLMPPRVKEIFIDSAQKIINLDWDPEFIKGYLFQIKSRQLREQRKKREEGAEAPADVVEEWMKSEEKDGAGSA